MNRCLLLISFSFFAIGLYAQFVIPDYGWGVVLGNSLPNAVSYDSGLGLYILDTNHPDVAQATELHIDGSGGWTIENFIGLSFFPALKKLTLENVYPNLSGSSPDGPPNLDSLILINSRPTSILQWNGIYVPTLKFLQNEPGLAYQTFTLLDLAYMTELEYLDVSELKLNAGLSMPNGLKTLDVSSCGLISLNVLPDSLEVLRANGNEILSIDTLPQSLRFMELDFLINWNQSLTSLPGGLPPNLEHLSLKDHELTEFYPLPPSLKHLDLTGNNISDEFILPSGLKWLELRGNDTITLTGPLPASLLHLGVEVSELVNPLPQLHTGLEYLAASGHVTDQAILNTGLDSLSMSVDSIVYLPPALTYLMLGTDELSMPSLPSTLQELVYGSSNWITTDINNLPSGLKKLTMGNMTGSLVLPNDLEWFKCSTRKVDSISMLGNELRHFEFNGGNSNAELKYIGPLSDSLRHFEVRYFKGAFIPDLPDSLNFLDLRFIGNACPPILPSAINSVFIAGAPCIPNLPDNPSLLYPSTVCNIALSPCPKQEELISGTVYADLNQNGVQDLGEPPIPLATVSAQPGNLLSGVDTSGYYQLVPDSNIATTVTGDPLAYHTLVTQATPITVPAFGDQVHDIGYAQIAGSYDLAIELDLFRPTRPGFQNQLHVQITNLGTEITTATSNVQIDGLQSIDSVSVTPANLNGNSIDWNVMLDPYETWSAIVYLYTDTSVTLGTFVQHLADLVVANGDLDLSNNTASISSNAIGSYDPNDKQAFPAFMTPAEVQSGNEIEYKIRFQNTGTYQADRVVITDTLSSDLDWSSFEFISSSHYCTWFLQDGVLHFVHEDIFLPDSTSDEPNSHGFVKFRITPDPNLMVGDSVVNLANIYFDFNQPVITDSSVFLVDVTSDLVVQENADFHIYPNPATKIVSIRSELSLRSLKVLQLDGRMVLLKSVNGQSAELNIERLTPGAYILQLEQEKGELISKRFVVHR